MSVGISAGLCTTIMEHCQTEIPREACGLLLGRGRDVLFVAPVENSHDEPEHHYRIAPEHAALVVHRAIDLGVDVLGGWHSHPDGPDTLSRRDVLASPGVEWLHVLVVPPAGFRAFRVHARTVVEIPVSFRPCPSPRQ